MRVSRGYWIFVLVLLAILLGLMSGCSSVPVVNTRVVEKPVPVYCTVSLPIECKDAYAVDKLSTRDDPLTINRAMRVELEERSMCEVRLRAAVRGCNGK